MASLVSSAVQVIQAWFGVYNVRAYGAKGDGTTDDATAINAAITAANAAGGGTVRLKPGVTYAIGSTINMKQGVALVGGEEALGMFTILKATSSTIDMLTIAAAAYGCTIRGVRFDAASAKTAGAAIKSAGAVGRLRVNNCFFNNQYDGIYLGATGGGNGVWIRDCDFNACANHGMFFGASIIQVVIDGCYLENSASTPISAGYGIGWTNTNGRADAIICSNTSIIGFTIGVYVSASNGWWNNVQVDTCNDCWKFDGTNAYGHTVTGCFATACTLPVFDVGNNAFWFKSGATNITVTGCNITRGTNIFKLDSCSKITLTGNSTNGSCINGIIFGADTSDVVITGNNLVVATDAYSEGGFTHTRLVHANNNETP